MIPENTAIDKSFYGSVYGLVNQSTMSVYVVQGLVNNPKKNKIGYIENNPRNCRDDFLEMRRKKSLLFDIYLTVPIMFPTEYMGKNINHPIFYTTKIMIYKTVDDIELRRPGGK